MSIKKFTTAAQAHARFTEQGSSTLANKAYQDIVTARDEMRGFPDNGIGILKDLLSSDDKGVKLWASYYLLPTDTSVAKRTLDELSSQPGLVAFSAKMTLTEWNAGRLKIE